MEKPSGQGRLRRFSQKKVSRIAVLLIALISGIFGTYVIFFSKAATACNQTVSSIGSVQGAVNSANPGDVVCLANGTYGKLTLSSSKASPGVTVQAQNPGQATIAGASLSGTYLTVAQFNVTSDITIQPGSTGMTIYHNTISGGYMGVTSCNSTTTACYDTKIIGNKFQGPYGEDAIRGNRYEDSAADADNEGLTVSYNEITGVRENGNHSDCLQTVWVGNGITFDHNYVHDNRCQGFFIKDQNSLCGSGGSNVCGTVSRVKVHNNIFTRNNEPCAPEAPGCGQPTIVQLFGPIDQLSMDRNTIWGGDLNTTLRDPGWSNVSITNNVIVRKWTDTSAPFNATYSASNNLFCNTTYSGSWPDTGFTSNCNPGFPGPDKARGDDFRLGGSQGVDWAPSQFTFGPETSGSPTSPDTAAPTVSLTAPSASATVSGTTTAVSANASDNVGVVGVQFKLDGNNLGSEDTSSPYTTNWDTNATTNGSHTLTAVARDAAGNSTTSGSVSVTVSNAIASGKRYIATNGNDTSNNCSSQSNPCLTFNRAYSQASLGDIVEVAAGTYSEQSINYVNTSPKNSTSDQPDVVFQPANGASVTINGDITTYASHVTVQNMTARDTDIPYDGPAVVRDVTYKNMDGRNFTIDSGININIIGGDYGPASSCGGSFGGGNNGIRKNGSAMPSNIVIDGVNFHDIQSYDLNACHIECLIIGAGDAITIKNSKFRNCSIFDIFLQPFNGTISNVTMGNNWFANPTDQNGNSNSGRAVEFSTRSPWNANWNNVTIRNNSFNSALNIDDDTSSSYSTYTNFKITGNILDRSGDSANTCNPGVQYNYNVWKGTGCGSSTDVNGSGSFPYINASNNSSFNYHLKPDATSAINRVPTNQAPSQDIDGDNRPQGSAAEAGSDEISGDSTPPPSDTTNPTVSFSSPAKGATVSGIVNVSVTANDNVAVTKVEFLVDKTLKLTDNSSPYNYSFDSKLLSNGTHELSAKAYDAAGNTKTETVNITVNNVDTTSPNSPTNLSAVAANSTTVNLSWTASTDSGSNQTGIDHYNVLRNGAVIAQPTTTSYVDTNRAASTTYSYVIQAVDKADNVSNNSNTATVTTPSAQDTIPPSTPTGLSAAAGGPNQVNLSWTASTDSGGSGLAGYNIYRNSVKINNSLLSGTSYGDGTASASTAYSYTIEAVDGSGNKSAKSAAATATTPASKRGDITGASSTPDGVIDLRDLSYLIRNYNTSDVKADVTGPNNTPDGKVDIYDLSFIIRNYGK